MSPKMSKKEIKKRAKTIEDIYQRYLNKLTELKKKQDEIINQFIKELEKKKIEEIRKTLNQL
jgi:F0F1-type ATP synthase membrane subunit b/b'